MSSESSTTTNTNIAGHTGNTVNSHWFAPQGSRDYYQVELKSEITLKQQISNRALTVSLAARSMNCARFQHHTETCPACTFSREDACGGKGQMDRIRIRLPMVSKKKWNYRSVPSKAGTQDRQEEREGLIRSALCAHCLRFYRKSTGALSFRKKCHRCGRQGRKHHSESPPCLPGILTVDRRPQHCSLQL